MKRILFSLCVLAVVCCISSIALSAEKPTITNGSSLPVVKPKPNGAQLHVIPKPDLIPTRIWVNPGNCRLWIEWKNQGGGTQNKTWTEHLTLSGSFRHGNTPMTSHSFDSRNAFAVPANYKENHEVTDLYEIVITGNTLVTLTVDGTNVFVEENETNNAMSKPVTCLPMVR